MAAKKKASKKTGKAIALPWQQVIAAHVKAGKAPKEKPSGGDYISLKGGKFSVGGVKIGTDNKGRELDCIVLGFIFEKSYYDSDYVEGESTSPACFAINYNEDDLNPHENSPNMQHPDCEGCDNNQWESGSGKGKACADRRRLALAMENPDGSIGVKMLNIPPTSLKNWKAYSNNVDSMNVHLMQCACVISFDEEYTGSGMPPLVFDFAGEVTSEKALQKTAELLDQVDKLLEQPYDVSNYKKAIKKKSKKKISKKKVVKKKRSKFS